MPEDVDRGNQAAWRSMLLGTNSFTRFGRSAFSRLPSPPRCEFCASPFKGPFAPLLRAAGRAPFPKNPRYCTLCIGRLMRNKGGAEVELTSLFADYLIPTAMDVPDIEAVVLEIGEGKGPFGARGIGEACIAPCAAAIASAIADAIGARVTELPMSSERVLAALRSAPAEG